MKTAELVEQEVKPVNTVQQETSTSPVSDKVDIDKGEEYKVEKPESETMEKDITSPESQVKTTSIIEGKPRGRKPLDIEIPQGLFTVSDLTKRYGVSRITANKRVSQWLHNSKIVRVTISEEFETEKAEKKIERKPCYYVRLN